MVGDISMCPIGQSETLDSVEKRSRSSFADSKIDLRRFMDHEFPFCVFLVQVDLGLVLTGIFDATV